MCNVQYFEYQPWVVTGTDRFSLGVWITLWKISKAYPETKFECGWQSQSFRNFEILDPNQLADGRSYMCASEDCESPGCECNTTSSRNAFFVMGSTEHQAASV